MAENYNDSEYLRRTLDYKSLSTEQRMHTMIAGDPTVGYEGDDRRQMIEEEKLDDLNNEAYIELFPVIGNTALQEGAQ